MPRQARPLSDTAAEYATIFCPTTSHTRSPIRPDRATASGTPSVPKRHQPRNTPRAAVGLQMIHHDRRDSQARNPLMCAKYALPSSVFMPSIIPYFPPHGKPFSVPRSYRLNAAILAPGRTPRCGKVFVHRTEYSPSAKKAPTHSGGGALHLPKKLKTQACLRRRRVANPASASRDSVAVVGSGTVYVILSPLRGVRRPATVSPVRVRVREAPSPT